MMSKVSSIILCGGKGSRLKEKTKLIPKPLIEVHGKPMLEHIINHQIEKQRISDIRIAVGYLGEKIDEFVLEKFPDSDIATKNSGENSSMLQRISDLMEGDADYFLISYGDTFIDLDLENFVLQHKKSKSEITVLMGKIRFPWGVLKINDDNMVDSFQEKPEFSYYIGCALFNKNVKNLITDELLALPDGGGLIKLFELLISQQKLAAYEHDGFQVSFNNQVELHEANEHLSNYFTMS